MLTSLNKWYLVDLTHPMVVGKLNTGKEIMVRVLGVDWTQSILVSEHDIYSLEDPDKVWVNTGDLQKKFNLVPKIWYPSY